MLNPTDLLAALPPPRDDEPPSLRSEIVDELLDHLQCAFRREILKDGDAAAAEKRVLSRFGDPKQLARRLWWQAMWSRVMGKRILSGLQWLLTLAAVFLAGAVLWQQSVVLKEIQTARQEQRAEQQALAATLNRLVPATASNNTSKAPPPLAAYSREEAAGLTVGPDFQFDFPPQGSLAPTLTVKLVQENEDGPPVTEQLREIQLFLADGRNFPGAAQQKPEKLPGGALLHRASVNGRFNFTDLEPDRYELRITLADGQHSTQPVLIRDDKPREMTVICPPPRAKASIAVTAPVLPDDLIKAGYRVNLRCQPGPVVLGETQWMPAYWQLHSATFDPKTGALASLREWDQPVDENSATHLDLTQARAEDRVLFTLTGPAQLEYNVISELVVNSPFKFVTESRTVVLGENIWKLEVPEEMIAARKELASPNEKRVPVYEVPGDEAPDAAAAEPLGDKCRLIVKLSSETKDGPLPKDVTVGLSEFGGSSEPFLRNSYVRPGSRLDRKTGELDIGILPAGRYTLTIDLPGGRKLVEKLPLIRPGQEHREHVICPPVVPMTAIEIKAPPVPADLRRTQESPGTKDGTQQLVYLEVSFGSQDDRGKFEGRTWTLYSGNAGPMRFDPESGLLKSFHDHRFETEAAEDRALILPEGEYRAVAPRLVHTINGTKVTLANSWRPNEEPPIQEFRARAKDNAWEIEVPEDIWAEARKKLAELDDKPAKDEPEQKAPEDSESPADAAAKTLRENARRPRGFGYDQNYAWLRGYVDFDREAQQWFIVYSAKPEEDARYAGNLLLGDHKLLGNLNPGDLVLVEGKVENAKGESAKPRYLIEKLQRLK